MTATEFIIDRYDYSGKELEVLQDQLSSVSGFGFGNITDLMKYFADYHVRAALKEAAEKVELEIDGMVDCLDSVRVDKYSILASYDLANIKE